MKYHVELVDITKYLQTGTGDADVVQCVSDLQKKPNLWRFKNFHTLRLLAQRSRMRDGGLVVGLLQTFYPHFASPTLALAHVYLYLVRINRKFENPGMNAEGLVLLWKNGRCLHYRDLALTYISDAQVALVEWVTAWNEKVDRDAEKHGYPKFTQ